MTIVLRKKKRSTLARILSSKAGSHHWEFGVSADKVAWRRNCFLQTERFSNAAWGKNLCTAVDNAGNAPDGSTTAAKITPSASSGTLKGVGQTPSISGTASVFTLYVAAAEYTFVGVTISGSVGRFVVNLTTMAVTVLGGPAIPVVEDVDGLWRKITYKPASSVTDNQITIAAQASLHDTISVVTNDGTSGIYIWHPQIESGTAPTAYQNITDGYKEFLAAYPLHHLFQDSTGTIPAYAITHPVGLCLDQPAGSVVWEDIPQNWVKASGDGVVTAVGNTITITGATTATKVDLSPAHPFVDGHLMAEFTVTWSSATSVRVYIAGGAASLSSGVKASYGISAKNSTVDRLQIDSGTATFVIHSLKLSRGSHASQSNSLKMPRLSARVNQFTATEDFSNAAWVKTNTTFATGVADPRGGTTAITITSTAAGGLFYQLIANTVGVSSCWMRRRTGVGAVQGFNSNSAAYEDWALTSSWQRLSKTGTSVTSQYMMFKFLASGDAIDIWHPDLRPANSPTNIPAYQRVTSANDYDTVGFPVRAVWDGVDDCLVVPTLDLSATDKVTVLSGLVSNSIAAIGTVFSHGVYDGIEDGMTMLAPNGVGLDDFKFQVHGASPAGYTSSYGGSPLTPSVVTFTADRSLSTNETAMRINGATTGVRDFNDNLSGNFTSKALYIGQKAGTGTPFSGPIQSITLIPALTTDAETAIIENSVNNSMGKVY